MKKNLLARGKFLAICFIAVFAIFSFIAEDASAVKSAPTIENTSAQKPTRTLISLRTSGPVEFYQRTHNNPSRLVILFKPKSVSANLREKIDVDRGMITQIHCNYYPAGRKGTTWLKAIEFVLLQQTSYDIAQTEEGILISFLNNSDEAKKSSGDLVISEVVPNGWGTAERTNAMNEAVESVMLTKVSAAVVSEKIAKVSMGQELSPTEMILVGAKALITNAVSEEAQKAPKKSTVKPAVKKQKTKMAQIKVNKPRPVKTAYAISAQANIVSRVSGRVNRFFLNKGPDFFQASLGLACLLLGALVVDRQKKKRRVFTVERDDIHDEEETEPSDTSVTTVAEPQEAVKEEKKEAAAEDRKVLEEMFLKDDELSTFNFKPVTEIVERRKYARADLRTSRGILTRALIGSKTQPFKKIRINDISKGGLSFIVGSNDTKFKAPTMIKLYFADSSKPVDLWVRVVWERQEFGGSGKKVGVRFTKVPKETWAKIMGAFGHKLG